MKVHRISMMGAALCLAVAAACSGTTTNNGESASSVVCPGGTCAPNDGVGNACTPQDDNNPAFSGYGASEVNVESESPSCATGLCVAAYFRGRVSCPYGGSDCKTPSGANVSVNVDPQLVARPPSVAVYCSCRCDGPDGTGPFCACPSGFECKPLVADIGPGYNPQAHLLAGSYCLKNGTAVTDPAAIAAGAPCDAAAHNCDDR